MADTAKYSNVLGHPYFKPFSQLTPDEQKKRQEEVAKEKQAIIERLAKKTLWKPEELNRNDPTNIPGTKEFKHFGDLTPMGQRFRQATVAEEVQAMRERLAKLPPKEIKKELEEEATETIQETNDKMSALNKLAIGLGIGALGVAISYLGSTNTGGVSRKLKRKRNKTHRRKH